MRFRRDHSDDRRGVWQAIHELQEAVMATQADVDALTTQVSTVASDLAKAQADIQAELDALSTANPTVDLTALTAAVAGLDPAVQTLGALKPDAPAAPATG
jgi:uncharacterized coiled-coil protein SlyX